MYSDQELVRLTLKGKKDSFDEIVTRYSNRIYGLTLRILKDKEKAEDLTQETFLRAYRSLDSYNPAYSLLNWLLKIASNLCIDKVRREKNYSFYESDDVLTSMPQSQYLDPESATLQNESLREIERALALLPVKYQMVLLLRYLEGLKYEEISLVLGEPLGTIKTQLHRARRLMKEYYYQER